MGGGSGERIKIQWDIFQNVKPFYKHPPASDWQELSISQGAKKHTLIGKNRRTLLMYSILYSI